MLARRLCRRAEKEFAQADWPTDTQSMRDHMNVSLAGRSTRRMDVEPLPPPKKPLAQGKEDSPYSHVKPDYDRIVRKLIQGIRLIRGKSDKQIPMILARITSIPKLLLPAIAGMPSMSSRMTHS